MMKNLFNFSVDKDKRTVHVERGFSAPVAKVWAAWTQSEILDQWWAPKPYHVETKSMDFSEGGMWLYAMVSPEGDKHWCRADYKDILEPKHYSATDAFCDENGTVNPEWPRQFWVNTFVDKGDSTVVDIVITYPSEEDLEKILEMGFREGFEMGLSNLDDYLGS